MVYDNHMIKTDAATRDLIFDMIDDDPTAEVEIVWPENYPGDDRLIGRWTMGRGGRETFNPNLGM